MIKAIVTQLNRDREDHLCCASPWSQQNAKLTIGLLFGV